MTKLFKVIFIVCSFVALTVGVVSAMNIFDNDFQRQWEDLFRDVKTLNKYTTVNPVELRNVKVENYDIEGVVFVAAIFSGVEWMNLDARKGILTDVYFKSCKFIGGTWAESALTNVTFDGCEFIDTSFSKSSIVNVKFKNCQILRTGIGYLNGETVVFENCKWDTGSAGDSSCRFVFRNTTLSGISFSMMKGGFPLLFEDCILDEVNFYKSNFSDIILRRVTQGEGPTRFNSANVESITFEDVEMTRGVSLAYVNAKWVKVVGGVFGAAFEGSLIASVIARDTNLANIDFSEAQMPRVEIANCNLYDLALWESFIQELSITNSQVNILDATDFKADTVLWDNVTLSGKIDLTNAQVKDFRPTRIQRSPDLQLVTTGSNMKF